MRAFGLMVLAAIALFVGTIAIFGFTWLSYSSREAVARNAVVAKQRANEPSFDTMWKILRDQAGVADEYKTAFKEIFPDIIKGRYANDKTLLVKFITEANPHFDTRLYLKVMNSIEAERKRFLTDQQELIDTKQQHDNLLDAPVGNFFLVILGGKKKIDITVVTSDKTEEAFKTGKDNDEGVFPKKKGG